MKKACSARPGLYIYPGMICWSHTIIGQSWVTCSPCDQGLGRRDYKPTRNKVEADFKKECIQFSTYCWVFAHFYECLPHVTSPWPHSPSRNKAWPSPTHSLTLYQPLRTLGGIFATLEQVRASVWSSRQSAVLQIPAPAQTFSVALLLTLSWVIGSLWPATQWTQGNHFLFLCRDQLCYLRMQSLLWKSSCRALLWWEEWALRKQRIA